jgi:hypothetical protein
MRIITLTRQIDRSSKGHSHEETEGNHGGGEELHCEWVIGVGVR